MAKRKAGLHKKISSIFNGVPVPEEDAEQTTGTPTVQGADSVSQPVPEFGEPVVPETVKSLDTQVGVRVETAEQGLKGGKRLIGGGDSTQAPDSVKSVAEDAKPAEEPLSEAVESVLEETLGVSVPKEPAEVPTRLRQRMLKTAAERTGEAEIGIRVTERSSPNALQQIKDKLFAPKEGVSSGRQKTMVIMVPALLIVLLIMLGRSLTNSSGRVAAPTEVEPTSIKPAVASTNIDWEPPELYPTMLRDPMMQAALVAVGPRQEENRKLEVRGIVYSQDNPTAVVGSAIVHEGDMVSGATVIKINKSSVEFEKDGKRWTETVQN